MSWQHVLDQKIDLYRFWTSPLGEGTGQAWAESLARVGEGPSLRAQMGEYGQQIVATEAMSILLSEPFYVEEDMWALVDAAAELFKPEPLQPTDLLTSHGFVVLPHPFTMTDRHEKRLTFRAFVWAPMQVVRSETTPDGQRGDVTKTGIHLSLYSHVDDMLGNTDDYHTLTEAETRKMQAAMGTPFSLAHVTPWAFGDDLPGDDPDLKRWHSSWWKPIQAFFRLTLQTISDRYAQVPPRAARKRAGRMLPQRPKEDYVTVIRLRRPKHATDDGDHRTVEWQHQWIVGGHWRNQWFPSLKTHRQIYIAGYVKGPEDKPLLVRKGRAFEFVR